MDSKMPPPVTPIAEASNASGATLEMTENNKRKRQPRNSACQACAALKMKCTASPVNGVCQRCLRMVKECEPSIPKPRKRRELDNNFDGRARSNSMPEEPRNSPIVPQPARSRRSEVAIESLLTTWTDLPGPDGRPFPQLFVEVMGLKPSPEMVEGIDYHLVYHSFTLFRRLLPSFPFLDPATITDPRDMLSRKPVTTLAICVIAMPRESPLQQRLSDAFHPLVKRNLFVPDGQTVDVISGLLIYIAWRHRHSPEDWIRQQIYLLVGMVTELMCRTPAGERQKRISQTAEIRRLFVGCYYLSCNLVGFCNATESSPMSWSQSLHQCAKELSSDLAIPGDGLLLPIVEVCRCQEDFEQACNRAQASISPLNLHIAVDAHAESAILRLESLRRQHQRLAMKIDGTKLTIHARRFSRYGQSQMDKTDLAHAVASIKDYFACLHELDSSYLHGTSIVEWADLLEAIAFAVRIVVSNPSGPRTRSHMAGALPAILDMEELLDPLVSDMRTETPIDPLATKSEGLTAWFKELVSYLKRRLPPNNAAIAVPHDNGAGRFRPVNQGQVNLPNGLDHAATGQGIQREKASVHVPVGFGLELFDNKYWEDLLQGDETR